MSTLVAVSFTDLSILWIFWKTAVSYVQQNIWVNRNLVFRTHTTHLFCKLY